MLYRRTTGKSKLLELMAKSEPPPPKPGASSASGAALSSPGTRATAALDAARLGNHGPRCDKKDTGSE